MIVLLAGFLAVAVGGLIAAFACMDDDTGWGAR